LLKANLIFRMSYSLENLRSKDPSSLEHAVSDKAVAKHIHCNN
jgi:hypothetical protein